MLQHRCFKNKYKITPGQSLVHHTWSSKEQLGRHSKKKHSVLCFVYILFCFLHIKICLIFFMTRYSLLLYVSTIVIAMILPSDEHNSITWQCSGKPVSLFRTETKINWKQIRCGNRGYISLAILFSIYYCVFVDGVHSTHMIFLLAPD